MPKRRTTKGKSKRGRKRGSKRTRKRSRKQGQNSKFNQALRRLKGLKGKDQIKAIALSNDTFVRQLCRHVKKLRRAKLSPSLAKRLRRHSKKLRKLVNAKTSMKSKRKILTQKGGIAPLLLAAIPALGSIVGAIIRRFKK